MRGYYISFEGSLNVNLAKKIEDQISVFSSIADVKFIEAKYYLNNRKLSSLMYRIPVCGFPRYDFSDLIKEITDPDFIYFRRIILDRKAQTFYKTIKKKYPACKIIVEIPTYPYYREVYSKWFNFTLFPKELYYRSNYKKYVDRFVTYSSDKQIFGVETISIMNGIDTSKYSIIKPRPNDDEIHMVAVAMFQKYHGYERVIEGIKDYYYKGGTRVIKLFMVGEGDEYNKYVDLTERAGLNGKVVFFGRKQGQELSEIYDNSDIGLGSFGFYKIGLTTASSLKTREYLAKGLPMIAGCKQDIFPGGSSRYYYEFANDSSNINMEEVVTFFDQLYCDNNTNRKAIVDEIREFAEEKLSISATLQPVLEYLEE